MAKITYNDKIALIENADIPDVNKVKADDMNEIKSVVNENAINISTEVDDTYRVNLIGSRNLFDSEVIQGVVTPNSIDTTSTTRLCTQDFIPVKPNTQYTLSFEATKDIDNINISSFESNAFPRSSETGWQTNFTFTTGSTTNYILITFRNSNQTTIVTSDISNIQLELGSTSTTYQPFIQNQIVVDNEKYTDTLNVGSVVDSRSRVNLLHSKNLCSGYNQSLYINSGVNQATIISGNTGLYIPVSGGDYTISTTDTQTIYRVGLTLNVPNTNSQTLYSGINKDNKSESITINTTGYNFLCITCTDLSKIQIEKGSTATSYEPFTQRKIVVDNEKYSDTLNVGQFDSRNRVNVLKSKNLLDLQYLQLLTNSSGTVISNNNFWDVIVDTRNISSLYISGDFSLIADNTVRVGTYSSYPVLGSTGTRITLQANGAINTSNVNYVLFAFGISSSSVTWDQVKASFMINEGSTALPYEPYIVPSIYVDNEMLVSKNVYSTGEVVIGEWFGKPLYRKVIEITNPTLDAWASVNHNIANMDFGRIVDATLTRTIYGTTSYIPIGVSNISAGTLFTCDLQKTIFEYKIAGYTNITKLIAVLEYTKTTD